MAADDLLIDALFPARLAKVEAAVRDARGALFVETRDDPGVAGALGIRRWSRRWRTGLVHEFWEDPVRGVAHHRFAATTAEDRLLLVSLGQELTC